MLAKVEMLMLEMVASLGDARSVELFHKVPKGKRLRAKLIFKIAGQSEEALKLAAIVELIHAASLLHDDVIDDAFVVGDVDWVCSHQFVFGGDKAGLVVLKLFA